MRLPVSLIWFALTGVIFLLQAFPLTGIFLMFLLAPFWSIATVNLGFISLAVEALIGKTSKLWLLAPIIWFGGYALFTFESHRAIDALDRELRQHNAGQSIAFSPTEQALVFANDRGDLAAAPFHFIYQRGLPVAYVEIEKQPRTKSRRRELPKGELPKVELSQHMASRLGAGEVCELFKSDKRLAAAGIYATYPGLSATRAKGGVRSADPRVVCNYRVPEDPVLPILRVAAKSSDAKPLTHTQKLTEITIDAPGGQRIILKTGYGSAYTWWPMPAIGCYLNSGAPSWNCEASFMKESPRGLGADGTYGAASIAAIATALKLEERPIAERYGEIEAGGAAQLETALAAITAQAAASLDQILAQPELKAKYDSFKGLTARPDILAPRADAIVQAISQALDSGGYSETPQHLQVLLAALPDADFARIAPDLVAALERERPMPSARKKATLPAVDRTLLVRLGDLGTVGLPVLEPRALGAGEKASPDAIFGLCRAGSDAAHLADPLALAIEAVRWGQDAHRAGVIALLRFGRADLVQAMIAAVQAEVPEPDAKSSRRSNAQAKTTREYETWMNAIRPNSPPNVCQREPLQRTSLRQGGKR